MQVQYYSICSCGAITIIKKFENRIKTEDIIKQS